MESPVSAAAASSAAASSSSDHVILESSEGSFAGMIVHAVICLSAACLFHSLVATIAGQNAQYQAAALAASLSKNNTQLELVEEEEEDTTVMTNGDYVQAGGGPRDEVEADRDQDDPFASRKANNQHQHQHQRIGQLTKEDMIVLTVKLWILMLLNYLLLVYLPGTVALSFMAIAAVWGLTLHGYLTDELFRRKRVDRVVLLIALFFMIAMSLTAFTYHRITYQQGDVYQGVARIVSYDTSVYTNNDGESLRTNLKVSWGGPWACPRTAAIQCQADVEGALCQTKYDAQDYTARRSRMLTTTNTTAAGATSNTTQPTIALADDDKVAEKEEEFVDAVVDEANKEVEQYEEEVVDEANAEVTEVIDVVEEEAEEQVEEEEEVVVEEDQEVEELEDEKEDLKEQNEALEEDLVTEEEEVEELEDELSYNYADDVYDSTYWDYDWDSVWGEYACEDLFDNDVNSLTPFDPDVPPGNDSWPTIQIYGSCRSCEAFLMDYYTTEHFLHIQEFKTQYFVYAGISAFLFLLAGLLRIREHFRPSQEKQIVLLNNEGGVVA